MIALVPAAGESRRMGCAKLLLPVDGVPVIARVVAALEGGGARPILVIGPAACLPGGVELKSAALHAGAHGYYFPEVPTADMRSTVEFGLTCAETVPDVPRTTLLITPADCPGLTREVVARVIAEARSRPDSIVVPASGGRRGHPLALPWPLAREIRELPPDVGINALVRRHAGLVVEVPVDDPSAFDDLDTPDDYRRWTGSDPPGGV